LQRRVIRLQGRVIKLQRRVIKPQGRVIRLQRRVIKMQRRVIKVQECENIEQSAELAGSVSIPSIHRVPVSNQRSPLPRSDQN
jgi:hypothetical protein